jgi:hypothetical protein
MTHFTQPQFTPSPSRASDVQRIKAAMESNGCTASDADIEYAYHRHCEKNFDVEWIDVTPSECVSGDMAARWVTRWMRGHGWKETAV